MTAQPPPACRHCTAPMVPGRLWGWLCTLCDHQPVCHRPSYHTKCLACGVRYEASVVKEITEFQSKHDRTEHAGASAWLNTTPPPPHTEGDPTC